MNQSRSLSLSFAKKQNLSTHSLRNMFAVLVFAVLWVGCETGGTSEIIRSNPEIPSQGGGGNAGSHEYVDLGLSVKWATMNVGANSPEDYGYYFAWGETKKKEQYTFEKYKWWKWNGESYELTKYCTDRRSGRVDNKTTLELEDDAARQNWGGSWRMPTLKEFQELLNNCTFTWTTQNGVTGCIVKSRRNGKFIFFPAAGYYLDVDGYISVEPLVAHTDEGWSVNCWLSTLSDDDGPDDNRAYYIWFEEGRFDEDLDSRYKGRTVRAVCP